MHDEKRVSLVCEYSLKSLLNVVFLTFHLHVLGLAELLLAGFLLLLLSLVVMVVHVYELTFAVVVVVLVSLALIRVGLRRGRAPGNRRMRVQFGAARVGPGLR